MILTFIILIILVLFSFITFNKLTSGLQNVKEAWADIDVQLKRRYDLIPNLVSVVSQYATHEKEIFGTIAQERTKALSIGANDIQDKSTVENNLAESIKSIFAISESYPELKANTEFLKLQEELTNTEDEIASARRIYNSNVADYNSLVIMFPSNIVALLSGLRQASFFQNNSQDHQVLMAQH
jgi:LemA protein